MRKRLIRLYPRSWRERYGEEFLALLETQRLEPRLVFDIVVGAVDAHIHAARGPIGLRGIAFTLIIFAVANALLLLLRQLMRSILGPSDAIELAYQIMYSAVFIGYIGWLSQQRAARCDLHSLVRRLRR